MAADVCKNIIDGIQLFLENACDLACSIGSGIGGICLNEIDDGLGLGKVQLSV